MAVILFFFNDTATTEIYTLSLHDALPIYVHFSHDGELCSFDAFVKHYHLSDPALALLALIVRGADTARLDLARSEEHTSELQSQSNLVCRLLLEKKKQTH